MSWPLVYVVMLTFNHYPDTRRALSSLGQSAYPNYRLLVVDNHSTDETVMRLRQDFPRVELIANPANWGFAKGINIGLRDALQKGAEYILVINNDVLVAPSMLGRLVEAMAPGVGATAPLIFALDASKRVWSSGFWRHPYAPGNARWSARSLAGPPGRLARSQRRKD